MGRIFSVFISLLTFYEYIELFYITSCLTYAIKVKAKINICKIKTIHSSTTIKF